MSEEKVSRFNWKKLAIGSAAAFGGLTVVFALLYIVTTPLSPSLAAEQYIEDHYDAIAEGVVEFVFQEHSLKTELVAEVGESIAEQVVPYSCVAAPGWETVGASCSLSFRTDQPMTVEIGVPVVVQLRQASGLFGQRGAVAYDSSIVYDGLAVNIPFLEQFGKVGDVAVEVADVTTGASGIGESVSWGVVDVEDFPIGDHSAILQLGLIHDDTAHQINLWAEISGQGAAEVNIGGTFQFIAFYVDGNSAVIHTGLMPDIDTFGLGRWYRYRPDLGWVTAGVVPGQGTGLSGTSVIDLDAAKTLSRIRINYKAP